MTMRTMTPTKGEDIDVSMFIDILILSMTIMQHSFDVLSATSGFVISDACDCSPKALSHSSSKQSKVRLLI